MRAAALLTRARADGLSVTFDPPDTIVLRGDPAARARLLPEVRQHKVALVAILTGPGADRPAVEVAVDTDPHWRWLIAPPDGPRFSLSTAPPVTRAEVEARHPGAVVEIEPDPAPELAAAILEPDAPHHLEQPPNPGPPLVTCRTCTHWRLDTTGDGSGLGRCLIDAPASKRRGSLWPRGEIYCRDHLEATP